MSTTGPDIPSITDCLLKFFVGHNSIFESFNDPDSWPRNILHKQIIDYGKNDDVIRGSVWLIIREILSDRVVQWEGENIDNFYIGSYVPENAYTTIGKKACISLYGYKKKVHEEEFQTCDELVGVLVKLFNISDNMVHPFSHDFPEPLPASGHEHTFIPDLSTSSDQGHPVVPQRNRNQITTEILEIIDRIVDHGMSDSENMHSLLQFIREFVQYIEKIQTKSRVQKRACIIDYRDSTIDCSLRYIPNTSNLRDACLYLDVEGGLSKTFPVIDIALSRGTISAWNEICLYLDSATQSLHFQCEIIGDILTLTSHINEKEFKLTIVRELESGSWAEILRTASVKPNTESNQH